MEKKKTKKPVKKQVKTVKKETVKVEEKVTKEENKKRDTKKLVYAMMYFLCSVIWVICGVNRAQAKESFTLDVIVSIALFVITVVYFISYIRSNKID